MESSNKFLFKLKIAQVMAIKAICFIFFVFLIVPILYLYELILQKKIKIVVLGSYRFSVLALGLDYFLARREEVGVDYHCFFITGKPVNVQLLRMFKRELKVYEIDWLYKVFFLHTPVFKKTRFFEEFYHSLGFELFWTRKVRIRFSDSEENLGQVWLREKGITEKDWFVCIFARDSGFLEKVYPNSMLYGKHVKNDWSYYNWRDSDIDDFIEAAKYIVERGGYVIRVGYGVKKPFNFKHEKVIDYSLSDRTDFLDIYLPAKCRFLVGTPGGNSELVQIFDKPRVVVNNIPIGQVPWGKNDLYIGKKVVDKKTGEYISLSKAVSEDFAKVSDFNNYDEHNHLDALGLKYENNSPNDILKVCQNMMDKLDGTEELPAKYHKIIDQYYDAFPDESFFKNMRVPLGKDFLLDNEKLFV